ncbi:hypothetical protein [uncultured Caulobacter sp.]|jgi:hypothetical protein|uniref:hypothetical protein n=1 Tax=uncultured Caulobacter sp. TaxID=158749 RepID=UPI002606BAF8|nr:hypothetical protein [uncultured Caulobacter sp.]
MSDHTIAAEPNLDLLELNQWVKEQEMTLGPITAIGLDDGRTAASFNVYGDLVTSHWAKIVLRVGDECPLEAGWTLICKGEAYVSGAATPVCVMRPG